MNSNESGVAKWSVLRSVTKRASGSASTSASAGWAKSWSPRATSTGHVTRAMSAGVIGPGSGRRSTAARATASLPSILAYWPNRRARLSCHPRLRLQPLGRSPRLRRGCAPSPRRRARTRCGRSRRARGGGTVRAWRWRSAAASARRARSRSRRPGRRAAPRRSGRSGRRRPRARAASVRCRDRAGRRRSRRGRRRPSRAVKPLRSHVDANEPPQPCTRTTGTVTVRSVGRRDGAVNLIRPCGCCIRTRVTTSPTATCSWCRACRLSDRGSGSTSPHPTGSAPRSRSSCRT